MKKKIIISCALMMSSFAFSQIGINTTNPVTTLVISAKNTTGTTTNVDGLMIPRVDRQRAQSMMNIPPSTLIYITGVTTGTQTGTTVNVDAEGYYYFNGTEWVKLHNPANISNLGSNIYNANGTLTGNRTVTQNANTLAFTGTATNAFSVDGNTFSVDALNNRIGIGTSAPTSRFELNSGVTNSSGLKLTNLTSASPVSAGATLGVNTTGDVVVVPGSSFSPSFGRVVSASTVNIAANATNYNLVSFTLPTAGTYLIIYSVRGEIQTSGGNGWLNSFVSTFPSAGNMIANTEILIVTSNDDTRDVIGGTGTGTLIVTVTGPTTYYVGIRSTGLPGIVFNNGDGRTSVSYVKVTP